MKKKIFVGEKMRLLEKNLYLPHHVQKFKKKDES